MVLRGQRERLRVKTICGLFGILGPGIINTDIDIFRSLGLISLLRGTDASGILQVKAEENKKPTYKTFKGPTNFASMVNWYQTKGKDKDLILKDISHTAFLGHNRAATVGAVTLENTHPFKAGNLIGFHNGTLIKEKYRGKEKTDSELLIKEMDRVGIQEALEELTIGNAYAMVIFNKETGRISFTRNIDRTLFFCFHRHREVMYYASESWMLKVIMKRFGQPILDDEVFYFDTHVIYNITPWNLRDYRKKSKEYDCFESTQEFKPKFSNRVEFTHRSQPWESQPWENWRHNNSHNKRGEIPKKRCVGCDKELNLVQQHYSKKLGYNAFICSSCVEFENQNNFTRKDEERKEVHVG